MKGISPDEKELIERTVIISNMISPLHGNWFEKSMLWALFLSYFSIQWANYFFSAWLPTYLQEGKHFSEQQMKTLHRFVFSVGILAAFLFGFISDRLIKKKGNTVARKSVALICFVIILFICFDIISFQNHFWVTASFVLADFSLVTIVLTCFSTCIDVGGDRVSTITGIMNFCGQSGAFIMSMIFGKLVDFTHSYETPQYVMLKSCACSREMLL